MATTAKQKAKDWSVAIAALAALATAVTGQLTADDGDLARRVYEVVRPEVQRVAADVDSLAARLHDLEIVLAKSEGMREAWRRARDREERVRTGAGGAAAAEPVIVTDEEAVEAVERKAAKRVPLAERVSLPAAVE